MNKTTTCLFALAATLLLTGCESALNKAALAGDTVRVQQLLDKGANINRRTFAYSRTPLLSAAETGSTNVIELLLSKGANINAPSALGWTPLIVATQHGHTECVKVLLAHGANIDQRTVALPDLPSMTAVDVARDRSFTNIVQLLEAASRNGGATAKAVAPPSLLPKDTSSNEPF